jgi:UDPglucose--hexose-1-phosphate uridylyltransferase
MNFDLTEHPHKRLNILTGEWVMVSPHRTKRPWQGKSETVTPGNCASYDPTCYLCPGNKRADGSLNEDYTLPFSFVNDFSALLTDTPGGNYDAGGLLKAASVKGICKVICFSPDHSLTLPQMQDADIEKVVNLWQQEFMEIAKNEWIRYIQIFENKGAVMGCSNPHPHGQIWSQSDIPLEIVKETIQFKKYFETTGKSLLANYLDIELQQQTRIICDNDDFVALVPFWAVWPYEAIIISRRHVETVQAFNAKEKRSLANIIKQLTVRYDNLFETSFPYSAGMHQSPVNDEAHPEWHWHMHFYPPLLRSATVKKFMVGYEMLGMPQRDITPEQAASNLRALKGTHYKNW